MALDRDSFIELLRRTTDEKGWLDAILDNPDDRAVLYGLIDQYSWIAAANDRNAAQGLLSTASPGVPGSAQVQATKDNTLIGELPAGTLFVDQRGIQYGLTGPIVIGAGATTVLLQLASLSESELVNTVDPPELAFVPANEIRNVQDVSPIIVETSGDHRYSTGSRVYISGVTGNTATNGVHTVTVLTSRLLQLNSTTSAGPYTGGGSIQAAPFGLVLDATTVEPVRNGMSDYLGVLAEERGFVQQSGESNADFRSRVSAIPDAVSPCAISTLVLGLAETYGIPAPLILEPYGTGISQAQAVQKSLGEYPLAFADADFYDDPSLLLPNLGMAVQYFAIVVTVPEVPINTSTGNFYDASSFFDADAFYDAIQTQDSLSTLSRDVMLRALYESVDLVRAHSVKFDIIVDGLIVRETASGDTALTGVEELVFTLTSPSTGAWLVYHTLAGISAATLPTTTYSWRFEFVFADATTWSLPAQTAAGSSGSLELSSTELAGLGYPGGLVAEIRGYATDDTITPVRLVASFWLDDATTL